MSNDQISNDEFFRLINETKTGEGTRGRKGSVVSYCSASSVPESTTSQTSLSRRAPVPPLPLPGGLPPRSPAASTPKAKEGQQPPLGVDQDDINELHVVSDDLDSLENYSEKKIPVQDHDDLDIDLNDSKNNIDEMEEMEALLQQYIKEESTGVSKGTRSPSQEHADDDTIKIEINPSTIDQVDVDHKSSFNIRGSILALRVAKNLRGLNAHSKPTQKAEDAPKVRSVFSLEEEDQILQAMLSAMSDQSAAGSELSADTDDVTALLDNAERLALARRSGITGSGDSIEGAGILNLTNNHVLQEELKRVRASAGGPTCVDSCEYYVNGADNRNHPTLCIGTALGLLLIFNQKNKLHGVCGGMSQSQIRTDFGVGCAVTSVSIARDGSTAVAGYEGGRLTLWDIVALQCLRHIDDFNTVVTRVSFFYPDNLRFIALDGNGAISVYATTRMVGRYISPATAIFAGYESPASDIALLAAPDMIGAAEDKGANNNYYVASICGEKLSVFLIEFGVRTSTTLTATADNPCKGAHGNELISWVSDNNGILLCAAWRRTLQVFLVAAGSGLLSLRQFKTMELQHPAVCLSALQGPCILVLCDDDHLLVTDCRSGTIAEETPLPKADLVMFKSRAIGICYHGRLSHCGGNIVLLGGTKLLSCSLLSWEARLDALVLGSRWEEAFTLARDLTLEVAVAAVGLNPDPYLRRQEVKDYILRLVTGYISSTAKRHPEISEYHAVARRLLKFCSEIDHLDLYFSQVLLFFDKLSKRDIVLLAIEDALLRGHLKTLPEPTMRDFVELFQSKDRLQKVDLPGEPNRLSPTERAEAALVRITDNLDVVLDIAAKLDLPRLTAAVLSLRKHQYGDALSKIIQPAPLVAMEYLERLFQGLSLVDGKDIPSQLRRRARREVLSLMIMNPGMLSTLLKSDVLRFLGPLCESFVPEDLSLLASDYVSKRTLSMKKNSSKDTQPTTPTRPISIIDSPWDRQEDTGSSRVPVGVVTRSNFFEALFGQLIDTTIPPTNPAEQERRRWPPFAAIAKFLILFSEHIAAGVIKSRTQSFSEFFQRVLLLLIFAFEKSPDRRPSIQDALVDILSGPALATNAGATEKGSPGSILVFLSQIEVEVRNKRLGRVHAALLARRGDYAGAISCYLNDDYNTSEPGLANRVFDFIGSEIYIANRSGNEDKAQLIKTASKHFLEDLVRVDATALAQFVFEHLPQDHRDVISALQGSTDTFLLYLRGTIAKGDANVKEDKGLQNMYIKLLCLHAPSEVYQYLVKSGADIQYDIDAALQACRFHGVDDAAIYLLEKTMQIDEAMNLLMLSMTKAMKALRTSVIEFPKDYTLKRLSGRGGGGKEPASTGSSSGRTAPLEVSAKGELPGLKPVTEEDEALLKLVNLGVDLCMRYCGRVGSDQLVALWFRLLDRFSGPKRILFDREALALAKANESGAVNGFEDNEIDLATAIGEVPPLDRPLTKAGTAFLQSMQAIYTRYIAHILSCMVRALPLSVIVDKIVSDNARERFGPFKAVINGILASLSFDLEISRLCSLAADVDTMRLARQLQSSMGAGLTPQGEHCSLCQRHLSEPTGGLDFFRIYACGHACHEFCIQAALAALNQRGPAETHGSLSSPCLLCTIAGDDEFGGSDDEDVAAALKAAAVAAATAAEAEQKNERSKRDKNSNDSQVAQDLNYRMQRLRQTKMRLDNGRQYREVLLDLLKENQEGKTKETPPAASSMGMPDSAEALAGLLNARSVAMAPALRDPFPLTTIEGQMPRVPTIWEQAEASRANHMPPVPDYDVEITEEELFRVFGKEGLKELEDNINENGITDEVLDEMMKF